MINIGKPKSSSFPLHEGIFPAYILFEGFHLVIKDCNLFIEKKQVNLQSSNLKFSLVSLLKGPVQSQLNHPCHLMYTGKKLNMCLKDARPGVFPTQPFPFSFDCLRLYLNGHMF